MDESGTLWKYWVVWSSRYFFIVFFLTKNPRIWEQAIKKVTKRMKNKKIINKWWVFHANHESEESIEKFLQYLSWKDFIIATYYIDKKELQWVSKDQHLLYNNMVIKLLKRSIENNIVFEWSNIQFYAARKETNKHLNKQFENQIRDELSWKLDIDIYLRYPHQEAWLQVVDSLAYAIYRKHENNYYKFYDIIKDNIKIEEELPKK